MTCTKNCKMYASVFALCSLFIAVVLCDDDVKAVKLRFYHSSFDDYTSLPIEDASKIFSTTWYNSSQTTVIFCHGFTGHPTGIAVTGVVKAYLEQGHSNVALLDWQYEASLALPSVAGSYLNWAAPNARKLGVRFAEVLVTLSAAGFDLNKLHLIGHSLGGHVFGITGNSLAQRGILLPRITGLDPASIVFEKKPAPMKLTSRSARVVVIVHSDPSKYGYKSSLGTVDFWPNYSIGVVVQPGCSRGPVQAFTKEDLCNHHRSWELLADAVKYPGSIIGSLAKNYRVWKGYSTEERNAVTLSLDSIDESLTPGNYFFLTRSESPYGLGKGGL